MIRQYGAKGLRVLIVTREGTDDSTEPENTLLNLSYDWNLGEIPLLIDEENSPITEGYAVVRTPTTLLVSPGGRIVARWDGFASAPALGLTLLRALGPIQP